MSKKSGVCALTLKEGKYVDAHILPKALTKPAYQGGELRQNVPGNGYKKRFSSWYDRTLVIREGEDILQKIDDQGIKALRADMLVWSSWKVFKPHFENLALGLPNHTLRRIKLSDPAAIHRFFLSIAWRACASKLPDMSEAYADEAHVSAMREALIDSAELAANFFPITLTQLTTIGETHNHTPVRQSKPIDLSSERDTSDNCFEIIRIYVDGLIAHVHLDVDLAFASHNPLFVGSEDEILITGVTYEASAQYENLLFCAFETAPDTKTSIS